MRGGLRFFLERHIQIRIITDNVSAKCISIIKKHTFLPISEIKNCIYNGQYILSCPYTDRHGLKKIIKCYKDLEDASVPVSDYELDDRLTTIDFLRNLDATYDEISNEIDAEEE